MRRPFATIAVVVIIVLVLLALVIALRSPGPSVRLTSEARTLFASWMVNHPKARAREQQRSGVRDVLEEPGRYLSVELREPEHADVAALVTKAGGVMDIAAMGRWLVENSDSDYTRGAPLGGTDRATGKDKVHPVIELA